MKSGHFRILRRVSLYLLLTIAIVLFVCGLLITHFELDDYRHDLEQELSRAVQQPVSIGHSSLTFYRGVALRFHELKIGSEQNRLLDISSITATLQLAPLLQRKLVFERLDVQGAKLELQLPLPSRSQEGTLHELSEKFGIHQLRIHNSSLKIHTRSATGSSELLAIDNLQLELYGWQPQQQASLKLQGKLQQPGKPASFALNVKFPLSSGPADWRHERLDYWLQVDNLANRFLPPEDKQQLQHINFTAAISGTPVHGAEIAAAATDRSDGSILFSLTGQLESSPLQDTVRNLRGELLGLPLAGEIYWLRQPQLQFIGGRFGASEVPLTSQLLQKWHIPGAEQLMGGTLNQLALVLEKTWPAGEPLTELPRLSAELSCSDLQWADSRLQPVQNFSTLLSLEKNRLTLHDSVLGSLNQEILFSGAIDNLFSRPSIAFDVSLQAGLKELSDYIQLPPNWGMSGELATSLRLEGKLLEPDFQLQIDATQGEVNFGNLWQKQTGESAKLSLTGAISSDALKLEQLALQLGNLQLNGSGRLPENAEDSALHFELEPINLADLQPYSPLLKQLELQGVLHPTLLSDSQGRRISLQLTSTAARLGGIVGDLSQTSGRIDLDDSGMHFHQFEALLGESRFVFAGRLNDWRKPVLEIDLQSNQAGARDLIFRNPELQLYDLEGRIRIDNQGVHLTNIKTRLEQATEAVVNGTVGPFNKPQVVLDITAEKANIDQVIGLFIGPSKTSSKEKRGSGPLVLISAHAKRGTIGELKFTNATGEIRDQGGVFTIYPLRFSSGKGTCIARIEAERRQNPTILKVSGHAEGIDATLLHQELFKKRGLINGDLYGDFYLEGALDNNGFWANAAGGIHAQVKNGTLRKFRSLAQVFSLLNVSQLFAGKLPDMDKEGMPFTQLEGSIRIAKGKAYTDDLRVTSEAMNMSLIGSQNLLDGNLDYQLAVMPLRTVDKVITSIPLAGWVLTGENKALLTAYFKIEGPKDNPNVTPVPVDTLSDTVFGVFKRTLGLPGKVVKDLGSLLQEKPAKKVEPSD